MSQGKFIHQLRDCPQPWPTLAIGTRHWFVKILRRVLAEHGFGERDWIDSRSGVSDYFGPELQAEVRLFQSSRQLAPDGIVGPQTWRALSAIPAQHVAPLETIPAQPGPGQTQRDAHSAERLRELALNFNRLLVALGVREHGGQNRGEVVDAVNRHTLGHSGEPWCATVQDFCVDTAATALGVPRPFDIGASSSDLQRRAKAARRLRGSLAEAVPGDIFIVPGGRTGWRHVGMVERVLPGGKVATLEGNTNDEGSAEGYEMCRRTRSAAGLAFVDWARS